MRQKNKIFGYYVKYCENTVRINSSMIENEYNRVIEEKQRQINNITDKLNKTNIKFKIINPTVEQFDKDSIELNFTANISNINIKFIFDEDDDNLYERLYENRGNYIPSSGWNAFEYVSKSIMNDDKTLEEHMNDMTAIRNEYNEFRIFKSELYNE
jgi:hypothetical protein